MLDIIKWFLHAIFARKAVLVVDVGFWFMASHLKRASIMKLVLFILITYGTSKQHKRVPQKVVTLMGDIASYYFTSCHIKHSRTVSITYEINSGGAGGHSMLHG